ncbi:MAG: tRNA uridine-5-carboxymethylaminomethyl(34) synthesis GTPase MnmE [Desulfovibrio sp.]
MHSNSDTIAAVATPPGEGGVGIIRISGEKSRVIADKIFVAQKDSFSGFKPYVLHYGEVLDSANTVLDDVLVAFMPGPNSFTGEDVIEINCHGGQAVLTAVLEEILALGARMARAGEFSLRAYLNGRLDLTQAEAIAEIIHAPSKAAMQLAQVKRSGLLGQKIMDLRKRLEHLRAQLCVAVDFPEDELECLDPQILLTTVSEVQQEIKVLLSGVERTRAWREGAMAVLLGRVNAGKSSLMNGLLGKNRAIVTDIPGTTRDYLEETLYLDGLNVRLVDTAGLRETDDAVEKAGLIMSRELSEQADVVLFVHDMSREFTEEDREAVELLEVERSLAVLNKIDLDESAGLARDIFKNKGIECVEISAKFGDGLDALADKVRERVLAGCTEPDPDALVPNVRQAGALRQASVELRGLTDDTEMGIPYDLLGVRLEAACNILAEITGEITSQEVLNDIFDNFCVGK